MGILSHVYFHVNISYNQDTELTIAPKRLSFNANLATTGLSPTLIPLFPVISRCSISGVIEWLYAFQKLRVQHDVLVIMI